jgi:hypothetical protein
MKPFGQPTVFVLDFFGFGHELCNLLVKLMIDCIYKLLCLGVSLAASFETNLPSAGELAGSSRIPGS